MKGHCYLDLDYLLNHKPWGYIEDIDPGFWGRNAEFILKKWKFDTDDMSSMLRMYSDFKDLEISRDEVKRFTENIGFSIDSLKEYRASLIQPR